MTEIINKQISCCFTGHRPEKLTWSKQEVVTWLEQQIRNAISDGFNTFISGMSRGVDIWAAEIVLRLRDEGEAIRLVCACPFDGFENNWSADWKKRYNEIVSKADFVKFISKEYSLPCFQKRNKWMVKHSSRVIAVFNGHPGGTNNTIDYAQHNPEITIISYK